MKKQRQLKPNRKSAFRTFRLEEDLNARIDNATVQMGVSRSKLVRDALTAYLDSQQIKTPAA